jgi:hypothetical protein
MPVPIDEIEDLLMDRGYQVVHETKKNKGLPFLAYHRQNIFKN